MPESKTLKLAARIQRVQPSPTLAITAKANALKAQGVDIISFGAGEPDFNTPEPVCQGAKDALDAGHTRYTPSPGIMPLRQAIAKDYARRGRTVAPEEVIVSTGGKFALFAATMSVFESGDRVIVPTPYWVSYPEQISLADAEPVFIECGADSDFKLTATALSEALQDDTITGLVLCSPSNPTGAVYTSQELTALGEVLLAHPRVTVFFDAMYDRLFYDGDIAPDLVATTPGLVNQVITFNGFSKTYAMTGWRLGYAIAPAPIIKAMNTYQSQSTSNPTSFAQYGALEALKLDDSVIDAMKEAFARRRDLIVSLLRQIPGVQCNMPQGAFYAFPDFSHYTGPDSPLGLKDDMALTAMLLEKAQVAVVPGSSFGAEGFLRLSYATSDELITEGIRRIHQALT